MRELSNLSILMEKLQGHKAKGHNTGREGLCGSLCRLSTVPGEGSTQRGQPTSSVRVSAGTGSLAPSEGAYKERWEIKPSEWLCVSNDRVLLYLIYSQQNSFRPLRVIFKDMWVPSLASQWLEVGLLIAMELTEAGRLWRVVYVFTSKMMTCSLVPYSLPTFQTLRVPFPSAGVPWTHYT